MGNLCLRSNTALSNTVLSSNPLRSNTVEVANDDDDCKSEVSNVLSEQLISEMPAIPTNLNEFGVIGTSLLCVFTDSFQINLSLAAPIEMAMRCLCGLAVFYSKVCFT